MTNPDDTELPPEVHPEADDAETSFQAFDFDAVDSQIHPEAPAHLANPYREAARHFISFYDQVLAFILAYENPRLAAYVAAMGSGRALLTGGISQKELADRLGITRSAVSKAVKNFQASVGNEIAGIEPMPGQRSTESCRKFSIVRNQQLTESK
jgi:hypothetical protein